MHINLDHISAALIGLVLVLILFGLKSQGQRNAMEATRYYSARTNMHSIAEMISSDFQNMRATASGPQIYQLTSEAFEFDAQIDSLGAIGRVRYEIVPADTLYGKPVFAVNRYVNGSFTGGVPATITEMDIRLLKRDHTQVINLGDLTDVEQVAVRIGSMSRFGESDFLGETAWHAFFSPRTVY